MRNGVFLMQFWKNWQFLRSLGFIQKILSLISITSTFMYVIMYVYDKWFWNWDYIFARFIFLSFCSKVGNQTSTWLKKMNFLLNQTLYLGCKIASSESEKSNLGQRYDNDNDVIHVSSRRLALCPHTLHWVAFEKNGVDTETVPPFLFEGT